MASEIATTQERKSEALKIVSKTNVKPKKPIGRKECQLVTFDLPYLAFYYNQKLLIYEGAEPAFEEVVEKVKDGLAIALEEFYQLAGKLDKDEDGVFKVVYDDDMEGVEVVTAAAEEVAVADLTAEEGMSKFKEVLPYSGVLNLEGMQRPLLAVQLTKLKDGLAMGLAFYNAILDGTSTWHFMSSWASICNGAPSVPVPPFLDRTKARNTRVKLDLSQPSDAPEHANASSNGDAPPPLREKVFIFTESAIDKINSHSPPFKFKIVVYGQKEPQHSNNELPHSVPDVMDSVPTVPPARPSNAAASGSREKGIAKEKVGIKRNCSLHIRLEDLEPHFGKEIEHVARELDVSRSTIKRACRIHEINRWPSSQTYIKKRWLFEAAPTSHDSRGTNLPPPDMLQPVTELQTESERVMVKARYEDEIIKFELCLSSTMKNLQEEVGRRLDLKIGSFKLSYLDEDDDKILLACDDDLQLCFKSLTAGDKTIMQLFVQLSPS